ncbi:MAG: polysaccharide biosynthesis/export family protein [Cyanobacteria bacterium J06631_9]
MQSARKPHYLLLLCLTLVGSLTSAQSVMAQDVLPTLPDASVSSDAVAPTQQPMGQPPSQAAPVPFRPPVQPTQTQPPLPQPLPQPLSPALPYNTNDPLKPGDVLAINVLGFDDLSGQQQVSSTGTIQLPLGGPIFVGGFTPLEAMTTIKEALMPYVRRPEVSVGLVSASPLRVSVSGEVLRPGPRLLEPINSADQTQRRPPTLSTALVESGGITPSADLRNIVIRRAVPTRMAATASPYGEFRVNLWDAVSQGDLRSDPRIFDGDEIIVPTAEVANIDQRTLLSSTVAPSQITVQVAGEVNDPGQLVVSPMVGVSGAIAAAGGPNQDADTDDVTLLRMMPDGRIEQISYAFGEASEPLIEGDVVFVEPSNRGNVGNVFDFVGRILNPFGQIFELLD